MTIKVVAFDFDGTIADTHDTFVNIVNRLSTEFGYQPVSGQELERLKHLSSKEIIKESKIPLIQIPIILQRIKSELNKEIINLQPFSGLKTSLKILKERGYILGIVTSNRKDNVVTFLENNDIDNLFNFVYSGTPLFGKDQIINRLIKIHKLKPENIIYVGDETRDIQASKKSHIKIISVGWGFNSPEVLRQYHPDYLIDHPQDLLDILEENNSSREETSIYN
ncbi:MAG: Phosphoglycolate phosphatase [Chroococcopsis gigantea SAG 12.99]|jgi:phosphoglycolate phosphatase|nr:HAD hydrolase-like protein [Chlorogloea purpurea SAG 13.99]MDV3000727.1 Phosphoglycolate phosphatase [Chroococcopsis gigantea SAG 12.99]